MYFVSEITPKGTYLLSDTRTKTDREVTRQELLSLAADDDITGVSSTDITVYKTVREWQESEFVLHEMCSDWGSMLRYRLIEDQVSSDKYTFNKAVLLEILPSYFEGAERDADGCYILRQPEYITDLPTEDMDADFTAFKNSVKSFGLPIRFIGRTADACRVALRTFMFHCVDMSESIGWDSPATLPVVDGRGGGVNDGLVVLPSVSYIGEDFCKGLNFVKRVKIPHGVEVLEKKALYMPTAFSEQDCLVIEDNRLPDTLTEMKAQALRNIKNTELTLPSTLKKIGVKCFADASKLTHITIPGSVTTIGAEAFHACDSLKSVYIEHGVKHIGDKAFYDAKCSLRCVHLPSSVNLQKLGWWAFAFHEDLSVSLDSQFAAKVYLHGYSDILKPSMFDFENGFLTAIPERLQFGDSIIGTAPVYLYFDNIAWLESDCANFLVETGLFPRDMITQVRLFKGAAQD